MYCIIITGIPASGKSVMAEFLSEKLDLPVFSKDKIKELLYDDVGFRSREEKVRLGIAAMNIMYHAAEQLMRRGRPFILENNFEHISRQGLEELLQRYSYIPVVVSLTGDRQELYLRFLKRDGTPERHRGHITNRYPEQDPPEDISPIPYEAFAAGIAARGMDTFTVDGPHITLDTTDFTKIDYEELLRNLRTLQAQILNNPCPPPK